jgi:tetratricopeptide (TPR) repeat protein
VSRDLGSEWGIGAALLDLALVAQATGDNERAARQYEECLAICRKIKEDRGAAFALDALAALALERGAYDRAMAFCRESLELSRELGDRWGEASSLKTLGEAETESGAVDRALTHLVESLGLFQEIGDQAGIAACLERLGGLLGRHPTHQSDRHRAAQLFGAAQGLRERVGAPRPPGDDSTYNRSIALARSGLSDLEWGQALAEGQVQDVSRLIESLQGLYNSPVAARMGNAAEIDSEPELQR